MNEMKSPLALAEARARLNGKELKFVEERVSYPLIID